MKTKTARPTNKQLWILEELEKGGHIERTGVRKAKLVRVGNPVHHLQFPTYKALAERGWLWQAEPYIWRITTAGRAVLARRQQA